MASDLATALVSGQSPGLMADPALAAIAPQLQMGQALSQQGMSTAAAYPAQALGRLGQALAGAYLTHDAQSQLTGLNAGSAESLQKIFPEGTPMGDALRSPSPLVKMLAMQNAGKSLLLNSESKTMGPNQVQVAPATPKYGGSITAMGSPALEGQVEAAKNPALINRAAGTAVAENPALIARAGGIESAKNPALIERAGGTAAAENPALIARAGGIETAKNPALVARAGDTAAAENPALIARAGGVEAAKNPALIARAGGEAAARAPNESGGTGVVQGPNGPVTIPITAETRRNMQPGGPLAPPSPPSPEAGQPMVPRSVQTVPGRVVSPGASSVTGEPVKNPAIEPLVKADAEELKTDRETAAKGQQDMATVRAIQDFLPKVQTGWSGETRLEAARILKSAGVKPETIQEFLKTDVASGQLLQKKFLELSAGAARTMGAREPGSVISMFAKAYPNLGTDEQAIKLQTNALYMDRVRQQELANQKTNHIIGSVNGVQDSGQYRGLQGFNEKFNSAHPTERYFSAAEAMSGVPQAWERIKDPQEQNAVINLIPKGTQYMSPDGKMRIKP